MTLIIEKHNINLPTSTGVNWTLWVDGWVAGIRVTGKECLRGARTCTWGLLSHWTANDAILPTATLSSVADQTTTLAASETEQVNGEPKTKIVYIYQIIAWNIKKYFWN